MINSIYFTFFVLIVCYCSFEISYHYVRLLCVIRGVSENFIICI